MSTRNRTETPTIGGTPAYYAANVDVIGDPSDLDSQVEILGWEGGQGDTDATFVISLTRAEALAFAAEIIREAAE